jgi:hypothetical protein
MPTPATLDERRRERRLRDRAKRLGYSIHKSRTDGSVYDRNGLYQGENVDNRGGYMIAEHVVNRSHDGVVVAGERFDLNLDDVERFFAD